MRKFKRLNMQSLCYKGRFNWSTTNSPAELRLWVNHNGIPAHMALANEDAIIMVPDSAGTPILALDNNQIGDNIETLINAYNAIYMRRRIAWVKLMFTPVFTSFTTTLTDGGEGLLTGIPNLPVYVYSEADGLDIGNSDHGSQTVLNVPLSSFNVNYTGTKRKALNRFFKVFRKSRKFPYSPKYNTGLATSELGLNPSGAWMDSTAVAQGAENTPHTYVYSPLTGDFATDVQLYTVDFSIKLVWADRRTYGQDQ